MKVAEASRAKVTIIEGGNDEVRQFLKTAAPLYEDESFDETCRRIRSCFGPGRGDGGVDLRLVQKDSIGEIVTLVQAKKYSPANPIALEAVQALYGVVEDEKASRGLFVTTSRYLPSAKEFAARQNRRLVLATSDDVANWCKAIGCRRGV